MTKLSELEEKKIKSYLKRNYYCLSITYSSTDCFGQEKEIDDQYIFSISLHRSKDLQTLIGGYIRKNLKKILGIFKEALYWECISYNDECYSFGGQPNEYGGEVFDLPDQLFQIYHLRRNNRDDP